MKTVKFTGHLWSSIMMYFRNSDQLELLFSLKYAVITNLIYVAMSMFNLAGEINFAHENVLNKNAAHE